MPASSSIAETVAFGRQAAAPQAVAAPQVAPGHSLRAAALVLAGGLLAGSAAFLISSAKPEAPRLLSVGIGPATLSVNSTLVRNPAQRRDGQAGRLDLALSWPGLEASKPPSPSDAGADAFALKDVLLVTILAADDGLDPSALPAQLYGRYLESGVEDGPAGLIRRSFRARSPYEGEVLFIAPPDGRRFAARCELARPSPDSLPHMCIAQFRRDGLDVQLRMDARLLDQWEAIDERLRHLVDKMLG